MGDFVINNGNLEKYTGLGGEVTVPEGVSVIRNRAFHCCNSLTKVTLPDGVTEIEGEAFVGCDKMVSISLPSTLTVIGICAFADCVALAEIEIPDHVQWIGGSAFWGCSNLKKAKLPAALRKIESGLFRDCSNLKSVYIPDGVIAIGWNAFSHCGKLKNITLPDGVTQIGNCAFYKCGAILNLPASLDMREKRDANDCQYLENVKLSGRDMSRILLYQSGKKWEALIAKVKMAPEDVALSLADELNQLDKVSKAQGTSAANFVLKNRKKINAETIQLFYKVLLKKNKASAIMLEGCF